MSSYKRWYPLVKWLLGLASLIYLYVQWNELVGEDAGSTVRHLMEKPGLLLFLLLLMVVNYGLESEKFRLLLNDPNRPGRGRSLLVIFSGVTISNFTPAKTGEYLGRSILLPRFSALSVILATVTGNLVQLFWTYAVGLLAFLALYGWGVLPTAMESHYDVVAIAAAVVLLGGLLIRYLPHLYGPLVKWVPRSWKESLSGLKAYRGAILNKALLLSLLRYGVFSTQYFLWLYVLSGEILPWYSMAFIPLIFLMQSLVPVPSAVDVGFRLYFAQFFFSDYLADAALWSAVVGIWVINLILPAVIGALHLLYSLVDRR